MDVPDRERLEQQYARLMGRLLREYGTRIMDVLGDPPRLNNIPASFWDDETRAMAREIIPMEQRLYLDAAKRVIEDTNVGVDWALTNQAAINWANTYTFDLVRGLNDTTREVLADALESYFDHPQTIGEFENSIQLMFGPMRAEMIAVTEITRASVEGEREIARELAGAGITMTEFWNTNNDELVCDLCGPLNGKPKGEEWTEADGPPRHTRCRCWTNHELVKQQ